MTSLILLALLLAAPSSPAPSASPSPNPFGPVQFLVGEWRGESEGQPGNGTVVRSYRYVLKDRFLAEENVSTYPAQPANPKGEVHEHRSFFSHDRARQTIVLRQFHQEGFVNQYVLQPGASATRLVFESEALENVPAGWKARETYELVSPDEFVETFELAMGDKPWEVYSRARFKRRR